jgi:hypothetical protein
MDEQIPSDVRHFLNQCVPSVGHLETLIFLYTKNERAWTVLELSREMRTNESLVRKQLEDLHCIISPESGNPDSFQFRESPNGFGPAVQAVVELYKTHKHAIINAIYSRHLDAIRSFSDAFKITKGEK